MPSDDDFKRGAQEMRDHIVGVLNLSIRCADDEKDVIFNHAVTKCMGIASRQTPEWVLQSYGQKKEA